MRCSNKKADAMRLSTHGIYSCLTLWWTRRDSNPRPPRCERGALPTELQALGHFPLYISPRLLSSVFALERVERPEGRSCSPSLWNSPHLSKATAYRRTFGTLIQRRVLADSITASTTAWHLAPSAKLGCGILSAIMASIRSFTS